MYYFVSLDTIKTFIESATSLDLSGLNNFQDACLFLGGNFLALLTIIFMISLAFKILVRLIKFAF